MTSWHASDVDQQALGASHTFICFLLFPQVSNSTEYSMVTADLIDSEVRELVEKAYARAKTLLQDNMDILHKLADLLLEKETVDGEEFMSLFIEGQAKLMLN